MAMSELRRLVIENEEIDNKDRELLALKIRLACARAELFLETFGCTSNEEVETMVVTSFADYYGKSEDHIIKARASWVVYKVMRQLPW